MVLKAKTFRKTEGRTVVFKFDRYARLKRVTASRYEGIREVTGSIRLSAVVDLVVLAMKRTPFLPRLIGGVVSVFSRLTQTTSNSEDVEN